MDEELRQHLEGMEARMGEMGTYMREMETRLREHVSLECEKVETKLLTEFHKWGRTSEMRTRQAITDVGLLGERLLVVEERISALERMRGA